jgi:hypothetical protein
MEQVHENDNHLSPNNDNESQFPPIGPIEQCDEDLCRTMWIAVILQAIIDAGGKSCNRLEQAKAREWLEGRGGIFSEFAAICELAGLDFQKTRTRCSHLIRGEGEALDFRCMKKPLVHNRMKEDPKRYYQRVARTARLRREKNMRTRLWDGTLKQSTGGDNRQNGSNDNSYNQPMERSDEQQAN